MNKNFEKKIRAEVAIRLKFYCTNANEYYVVDKNNLGKGALYLNLQTLKPIFTSIIQSSCSHGDLEYLQQRIQEDVDKNAIKQEVYTRVGFKDGAVYLDLGARGIVKVTGKSIKILKSSLVPFIRNKTMKDLPEPDLSEDLDPVSGVKKLYELINVCKKDRFLVLAWLMSLFCESGNKPILLLEGIQGSAKSSTFRNLARIVDWHEPALIGLPGTEKDLFIFARNRGVLFFDNVSHIRQAVSDWLCTISTGGAMTSRKLFTDGDEFVLYAHAPSAINGITLGAIRGDLLDRAIKLEAPVLAPGTRKTEEEIEAAFEEYHPIILGSLLRIVQYGLKNACSLPAELRDSRLVDFAEWTYRWAPAIGTDPGKMVVRINDNQRKAKLEILSEDTLCPIILTLINECEGVWEGTSTELFKAFMASEGGQALNYSERPKSPRALTAWLKRAEPALNLHDVQIERKHGKKGSMLKILGKFEE